MGEFKSGSKLFNGRDDDIAARPETWMDTLECIAALLDDG